jgi:superfamily II DNA or RNA helicase
MENLYEHQRRAIQASAPHKKCLINMWCGTGKTRTFTVDIFIQNQPMNVIVFPSLCLIQQYSNDYILEQFQNEFEKFKCLAFCSDDDGKLKSKGSITFTTNEKKLIKFIQCKHTKIIMVTYQSFEKFICLCIDHHIQINILIYDEAHHIVGDKIQNVVFNNEELDSIVDKTRFYTATPVNKNGITMYDKEESDCGVLAYEYLYYQAIQDNICKPFETHISLYTQIPECKIKNQPIFESIIRACLSGKYSYWNVLTFHSFVEESDTQNTMISFVKEFASTHNQALLKKLFTKIQNEEFPRTKENFRVEHVILKGVSSKTPCKEEIIKDFDRKVEGRIYILASCGILNEGIDTKWANICVPINPTKSIVKESQRIGRLVRIPEKNMSPAIILIPCQVDITKYSSMDTPEKHDQMIREQLSECGNFNTALNVISAFQYQYDSDIFEMCLQYPNMYAPKEVKDNLEKHGLHVVESQGTLIDNLKYLTHVPIDISEESDNPTILNQVAKQRDKTIEIYTQNYDQPIKYINEEANDDEPLRLFYCDKTYSPIVKTKENIPKITSPKKRPKLFNVHMHPDLEVLWNIREDSIDLNKAFSQGILDVNIHYNDKKWKENYELLVEYNDTPTKYYVTNLGIKLGNWCDTRRQDKKMNKLSKERIELLEKIPNWYWDKSNEQWNKYYTLLVEYNETPSQSYVTPDGFRLGCWTSKQRQNKNKLSTQQIELLEQIPNWFWERDEQWNKKYTLLVDYNDIPINSYVTSCGVKLGTWCDNQRQRKCNLTQEQIELLEKIPNWYWDQNEQWNKKYKLLKEYNDTPDTSYITNCGIKLGNWCCHQRSKKELLTEERIELLEKIPNWYWDKLDEQWEKHYKLLCEYNDTPEHLYATKCGIKLGSWCNTRRQDKKKDKLSQEQIELLEKIPNWYWDKSHEEWYKHYIILEEYNDTPSQSYVTKCGFRLGGWCSKQRQRKCNLTQEQIELLEKIPNWYWDKLEEEWEKNYTILEEYNDIPSQSYVTPDGIHLGCWTTTQRQNKKKNKLSKERIELLEKIPNWYWDKLDEQWNKNYTLLEKYNDTPINSYVTECGVKLGSWCCHQRTNKKKEILSQSQIELLEKIPNWYWDKKDMSKPEIKPHISTGCHKPQSELSELHKKYKSMTSGHLHEHFKQHPDQWDAYHKISQENERSFPTEDIPRNKMIHYLNTLPGKKRKVVADLGCGRAEINEHFKENNRFEFHNFDHHSDNDTVISRDIKHTPLEDYSVDIVILSLAMWGSNCKEYIQEAYRILDTGGTLLIAEPYKRWNKLDEQDKPVNKLVKLLEKFTIIQNEERKFMFIECRKMGYEP